jgi:excisionase family DNA binding protein
VRNPIPPKFDQQLAKAADWSSFQKDSPLRAATDPVGATSLVAVKAVPSNAGEANRPARCSAQRSRAMSSRKLPAWLPSRLMTVAEAAEILRCSQRQVRRLIADKKLAVLRLGRRVLIKPEALVDLLEGD